MQMIPRALVVLPSYVMQSLCDNNMPPRRTSVATARAASAAARAAAATTAAPMIVAVVEQLNKARLSTALANHETL
ncbi:hypothetical protein Tco_0499884 [Tanacetum coccineum]